MKCENSDGRRRNNPCLLVEYPGDRREPGALPSYSERHTTRVRVKTRPLQSAYVSIAEA